MEFETEQEIDGSWIAEAVGLPSVMAYGASKEEAISNTRILAKEVMADRLKHNEEILHP